MRFSIPLGLQFLALAAPSIRASLLAGSDIFLAGLSQLYFQGNGTERSHHGSSPLLERQLTCDAGFSLCSSIYCCSSSEICCQDGCGKKGAKCCRGGGSCNAGEKCCAYGCVPSDSVCCNAGNYCPSGWNCCPGIGCAPEGGECCGDGGYCTAGNKCFKVPGYIRNVCCTDSKCTASVSNGVTSAFSTPAQAPTQAPPKNNPPPPKVTKPPPESPPPPPKTTAKPPPTVTTPPEVIFDYYTFTYTWTYWYYFWTYWVDIQASIVTSTSTTSVSTIEVSAKDRAGASSSLAQVTQAFTTPKAATSLASLTGKTISTSGPAVSTRVSESSFSPTSEASLGGGIATGAASTATTGLSAGTDTAIPGGESSDASRAMMPGRAWVGLWMSFAALSFLCAMLRLL